jgi:hypothetical protein
MIYTIYKLYCKNNPSLCYIGSTKNINKRKITHKCCYNNNVNLPLYISIRENGEWDNWDFEILEIVECISKKDALKRERYYIENTICINCVIPIYEGKDYWKDYWEKNKNKLKNNMKIYYDENKQDILDYHKKYNIENKDKIKEYRHNVYEQNKQEILNKNKKYRDENKDKIALQRKEKVICSCGKSIRKSNIMRHKKINSCV